MKSISKLMPSPQKTKGSGFEREIAKYLSDIYGESFIRAPGSGAYVGGKNQSRTAEDRGQRKADDSSHGADGCPFRSPTCYYNHQRHNHQRHEKG